MVVEALSTLFIRARELGMIQGFEMNEVVRLLLLLSLTKREELLTHKKILRCFQLVLGLKIN